MIAFRRHFGCLKLQFISHMLHNLVRLLFGCFKKAPSIHLKKAYRCCARWAAQCQNLTHTQKNTNTHSLFLFITYCLSFAFSLFLCTQTHTDRGEGQAREAGCLYPEIRGKWFKQRLPALLFATLCQTLKLFKICPLLSVKGVVHCTHLQVRWKTII